MQNNAPNNGIYDLPEDRGYVSTFKAIAQLVPEKKIVKGFFTIYGNDGHVGHMT